MLIKNSAYDEGFAFKSVGTTAQVASKPSGNLHFVTNAHRELIITIQVFLAGVSDMTWNHLGFFVRAPLAGAAVDTLGGTAGR